METLKPVQWLCINVLTEILVCIKKFSFRKVSALKRVIADGIATVEGDSLWEKIY